MAASEKIRVKFGLIGINGKMNVLTGGDLNGYLTTPIFAHDTFPVTCTINSIIDSEYGKLDYLLYNEQNAEKYPYQSQSYQKVFRKIVRWDFGDGTEIEGYTATHHYTTPGKYKITCTFFDIDRKGTKNVYSVSVIVKQVIATKLRFNIEDGMTDVALKHELHCSATEQIARIEAFLSSNITSEPDVIAKRIYKAGEDEEPTWDDVKEFPYPHLRRYWCFLKSEKDYYHNTNRVWNEEIRPSDRFTPNYNTIYGKFIVNEDNEIEFDAYYINPYKGTSADIHIAYIDPHCKILEAEENSDFFAKPVSSIAEIPEGYVASGKYGYVDIYYRSDFVSEENVLSFFYDMDSMKLSDALESGPNFLNMMPLGMKFAIVKNDINDVEYSITLNGFITSYEGVDKLTQLSLLKDYDFTGILVPYIQKSIINYYIREIEEDPLLMEAETFILSEYAVGDYFQGEYYIPKDFIFSDVFLELLYGENNDSKVDSEPYEDADYLRALKFTLKNILEGEFTIGNKKIELNYDLYDLQAEVIPTEKLYKQNVDQLIDVYTPHPLFDGATNLKGMLSNVFKTNNMLNYVLTKGMNFFDDQVNVKTNYVDNLVQTLTMMGQDISQYSETNFDGVNELKDLTRILTMNHSELMGNYIDEAYDIRVTSSDKGKHVGERILVTDKLYCLMDNEVIDGKHYYKGKVTKIVRTENKGKSNEKTLTFTTKEPVALIMVDDYARESRIISFSDIQPRKIDEDGLGEYVIADYVESWGWNMLLPEDWQKQDHAKMIDSYYSFYLLVPPMEKNRIGNFLDPETITDEMVDPDKWIEEDGITFRQLQKVIHGKTLI